MFQVEASRCLGAACGVCWTEAPAFFRKGDDGRAVILRQPRGAEVPPVRQVANRCQASPSAIIEVLETGVDPAARGNPYSTEL